jgi:hypothetical protein
MLWLYSVFRGVKMSGDSQVASRDKRGRMLPGNNSRTIKRARVAARLEELRAEYDPAGNASAVDQNRLRLAAMHYIIAETARDPTVSVRSTRTAEYLLSKIKPPSALRPAEDQAAQALALLLSGEHGRDR